MGSLIACGRSPGRCEALQARQAVGPPLHLAESALSSDAPPEAEVAVWVDTLEAPAPISPWIYGANFRRLSAEDEESWFDGVDRPISLARLGGNRMSTFNWENGASNSGRDQDPPTNDGWLGGSGSAGGVLLDHVDQAHCAGAAALVTLPILGWVAADRDGPVTDPDGRFLESVARGDRDPTLLPNPYDGLVRQDEMVTWSRSAFPGVGTTREPLFLALGNEPSLWPETHPLVRQEPVTYAEILQRTIDYGSMVRALAPEATVFAGELYGWNAFTSLQDAPDAGGRDFLPFFLDGLEDAGSPADVLALHWYSEIRADGVRITETETSSDLAAARVQAPRSLWDPDFLESSWIGDALGEPIRLLPRVQAILDAHAPAMGLALTEYDFGGGDSVDGAIAQADALGIFGRTGIFAATWWALGERVDYTLAAFDAFLDFDGAGGSFGDVSVPARSSDLARVGAHASVDADDPGRVVVVLLNRDPLPTEVGLGIRHTRALGAAARYDLTAEAPRLRAKAPVEPSGANTWLVDLPGRSVVVLELTDEGT